MKKQSEDKNEGWISLHRKIQKSNLYPKNRPFTTFEAWIDLLLNANHTEQKVNIKFEMFICKRGQLLRSQEGLSLAWNWDRSSVRRFLKLLEKDQKVTIKTTSKTTVITICNYDKYQGERPTTQQQNDQRRNTNNNDLINFNKGFEKKVEKININPIPEDAR